MEGASHLFTHKNVCSEWLRVDGTLTALLFNRAFYQAGLVPLWQEI
jgi:hypothetical protein